MHKPPAILPVSNAGQLVPIQQIKTETQQSNPMQPIYAIACTRNFSFPFLPFLSSILYMKIINDPPNKQLTNVTRPTTTVVTSRVGTRTAAAAPLDFPVAVADPSENVATLLVPPTLVPLADTVAPAVCSGCPENVC